MRELGTEKKPESLDEIIAKQTDQITERGEKTELSREEREIVSKFKTVYKNNREKFKKLEEDNDINAQIELSKQIVSETPIREASSVERILNGVIGEFEHDPDGYDPNLGCVLQSYINRMAEYADKKYMGKPEKNKFKIALKTFGLKKPLDFLAHTNPNNVELVILGDVRNRFAFEMNGGRATVVGDARKETGKNKKDGNVLIIGNVEGFGERPEDKGKGTLWQVAPRVEKKEKKGK